MKYNISEDIKSIREILGVSQDELAKTFDVQQATLSRNEQSATEISDQLLEQVYDFAFKNDIKLGKLKEMLIRETMKSNHILLFHGSKSELKGDISVTKGRVNNDFGQGFYTGESYDQAVSFVTEFDSSSVYFLDFDETNLECKKYKVDQDWMLTIAYYRGTLDEYENHPIIKKLIKESRKCDYIIAPIADNRMFQIINSFIAGEITDEQCKHCLAATNLGNQYIFTSEKAAKKIKVLERSYICSKERDYYKEIKLEDTKLGDDKVKLARRQYRGKGKYIDDILK